MQVIKTVMGNDLTGKVRFIIPEPNNHFFWNRSDFIKRLNDALNKAEQADFANIEFRLMSEPSIAEVLVEYCDGFANIYNVSGNSNACLMEAFARIYMGLYGEYRIGQYRIERCEDEGQD